MAFSSLDLFGFTFDDPTGELTAEVQFNSDGDAMQLLVRPFCCCLFGRTSHNPLSLCVVQSGSINRGRTGALELG